MLEQARREITEALLDAHPEVTARDADLVDGVKREPIMFVTVMLARWQV